MEFYFNNYLNKPITAFDQKNFDAAFKKALANEDDKEKLKKISEIFNLYNKNLKT